MERITDLNLKALILKKAHRQASLKCCIFDVVMGITESNVFKPVTEDDFPPYKTICTLQASYEDIESNVYYHAFINHDGNAYLNKNYDKNITGVHTKWYVNIFNVAKLSYNNMDLNLSPIYSDKTTKDELILNQDLEYFFIHSNSYNDDVIRGPFLNRELDPDTLLKNLHKDKLNNLEVSDQFKDIRYVLEFDEDLNTDNFVLNYTADNLRKKSSNLYITTDPMNFLKSFSYLITTSNNQRNTYKQCITLFFLNKNKSVKSFNFIKECIEEQILPILDDEIYDKKLNKKIRRYLELFIIHRNINLKEDLSLDSDDGRISSQSLEDNGGFDEIDSPYDINTDEQEQLIDEVIESDTKLTKLEEKLKFTEEERDEYKQKSNIIKNSATLIKELKEHNSQLTKDMEELQNNYDILEKEKIKLAEVSGLHLDNEKLKLDNDDLTEKNTMLKGVRRNIENEIEINKQEKTQLEEEIFRISKDKYVPAVNTLLSEAFKQSPLIKLIAGIDNIEDIASHNQNNIEYQVYNINENIDNSSNSQEENIVNIFNFVYTKLNELEYRIDPKLLSAILISLAQNTLVMLAGDPGNGKTSLSTHISEILKLAENNFAHIAVARDWTTSDDLIGFYNNINNKFQSANNDIYKLMQQTHQAKNNPKAKMNLVLLDEANLSPLEYYLSDFISQWDKEYITINISHKQNLQLDHKFKMIATLNTDYTTESISPRMRDRANIIWLNNSKAEIQKINKIKDLEFSADDFFNAYNSVDDQDWSEYFITINNLPLIKLSERKKKSLQNFCNIAEKIKYNNDKVFSTLEEVKDYAFAISCIPTISTDKESDINDLISKLRDLRWSYSRELLENIHKKNQHTGYYDLLA